MEYNNEYNMDLYPAQVSWQEGDLTATRTTMWSGPGCHSGCQIIFYTDKDGKLVKTEGDPNSPMTQGRLCMRCLELPQMTNNERRLKYPMKRAKEDRGKDAWERISWDEAFDLIAEKVKSIQEEYGPEAIVSMIGTGRNVSQAIAHNQYANFGGPDLTLCFLSGDSCMLPRTALCYVIMGNQWVADFSQFRNRRYEEDEQWVLPECCVVWGTNPVVCNSDAFLGHWIVEAMKRGTELITIDPQLTWMASRSKYWLQIRPGTDAALALGFMNVIINEGLYDKDWVERWTYGFEQLAERVQEYPPAKVAQICEIDEELLVEAARFYAKAKPATVQWGLAVDMSKIGVITAHAIACLVGITGNIEKPGGNILIDQAANLEFGYNSGIWELEEGMVEKRLGVDKYPLKKYGFTASSQADSILEAIETDEPRPVKMLWIQSANPIANMGQDAPRIYRALHRLDFVCFVDLFMTPTAMAVGDLILPCAMSHERNCIRVWFDPLRTLTKCGSYYEAKSDEDIMIELGHRIAPDKWPDFVRNDRDYMNWRLERDGVIGDNGEQMTMDIIENEYQGMWYHDFRYNKHEQGLLRPDGQPGFMTPTGRYELYCTLFASFGDDPLPYYEEPPTSPISTPELYKEYPFVLTTGKRSFEFFHSEWRQPETISRELHPVPYFDIHPNAAERYGIKDGDWCWIENQMGKMRQVARVNPAVKENVLSTEHGWWFPEEKGEEPSLFGVFDCNPNNLIPQCENGTNGYGAPIKCGLAKVYPCTPENTAAEEQPSYQVTTTGYTHGPSHVSETPSFYDKMN